MKIHRKKKDMSNSPWAGLKVSEYINISRLSKS